MILGGEHGDEPLAVSEGEDRKLLPLHEFFDEDLRTGVAVNPTLEHRLDGAVRFIQGRANDNSFAGRKARRFDDDRGA